MGPESSSLKIYSEYQIGCNATLESSDLPERKRLRVADLGVGGGGGGSGGGGRLWLLAMLARKVEQ